MEPLLPSEVARLIYGYLKKEKNEDTAECFLKSSPHLTECYQMFKANRNFNIKVNGFQLHDIFDIFGTMCSMINERIPETCESKTLIEKLQYLLDVKPINKDKCVETELNMIDKCVGCMVSTENKSTYTTINSEDNKMAIEDLETQSFSEIISSNVSKSKEIDTNNETNTIVEKNSKTNSSPCLSSTSQALINNNGNVSNFSEEKNSPLFQINEQICSTPAKKVEEIKISVVPLQHFSPKNTHNQISLNQLGYQQIPEATSLESMPGLSKEDRIKDNSVIIDTGELVDTFLSDQSLLEKIADTINKSIEIQKETNNIQEGNVLDPPTLEKALDSTQSDPQIKNVLDEFLVFNVDNPDDSKKENNETPNSIKSRLRSAKKNDDGPGKSKQKNLNTPKHSNFSNDECAKFDTNILLVHEGNIRSSIFESYDLLSHQVILQPSDSNVDQYMKFENAEIVQEEDSMIKTTTYRKIAPKISSMVKTNPVPEKRIFPKRKKRSLQEFGIRSNFRKSKINSIQPPVSIQSQTIIIEVPNQNTIETQTKNKEMNNINNLSEISEVKNVVEDTPNDRLKPPKNKSMSTPRRRSTHIRCLDFSTPQPKSNSRDQARSKLSFSPKKCEKILEEPSLVLSSSPLPKLQADWGSVNGFESIVKKENIKHWDTDIREMVGAGILTSDADGRKTKKKKTPRKKIKPASDKSNPEIIIEEPNNVIQENELTTDETIQTNISEKSCNLNDQNSNQPLLDDQNSLKEQQTEFEISNKDKEICSEQPSDKSHSLKSFSDLNSLIKPNEIPISLETPDKVTELYNETPSILSDSLNNLNNSTSLKHSSEFPISLETPDKIAELNEKSSIISDPLKCFKDPKSLKKTSEYPISLETPNKCQKVDDNSFPIQSNTQNSCESQNNLEQLNTNINRQENNLNQSNNMTVANTCSTSSISETLPEITENCNDKDSNFSKTLINLNSLKPLSFKLPENKKNEPVVLLEKLVLPNQIKTNKSNEPSPVKRIDIQPVKQNQVETPYKCDDSAVDVPETPISKLIREYDPSKLVTPLPCTPEHYEDSLTETPLTKVFRETSYLNRPPISPFPPTPGNSMSVDTLIVPLEQDNPKMSNSNNNKINGIREYSTQPLQTTIKTESSTSEKKVKVKAKQKISTKSKMNNNLKKKSAVDAKKKQVYESVKVDLFGSVITSSSSADELEKTNEHKTIVINKKLPEKEKTSGFKPIPKRKSIQPSNVADKDAVNDLSNKLPLTKKTVNQSGKMTSEKTKKTSNFKQVNKSKKSMVHFDDPVEEFFKSPSKQTPHKSNDKNKIVNDKPEQLVGLSRYLNKSSTFYECNPIKKRKIKTETKTSKLNKSDSSINYIATPCKDKSKLTSILNDKTETHGMSYRDEKKNSSIPTEVILDSVQSTPINTKVSNENYNFNKKDNNESFEKYENYNSSNNSMKNTSCVTVGHNDEIDIDLKKVNVPSNNIEYLNKPKIYEVITEDGGHEMVYLKLSKAFVFLNLPSELLDVPQSSSIPSPLLTNKKLDVTPVLEPGELSSNCDNPIPVTSTPKDVIEKKDDQKQNRARRSPSFWEDTVIFPTKYQYDRHRESNRRINKSYRDNRYDKKSWSTKSRYHENRFRSEWNQGNVKRDFGDKSIRDKERSKYRDDKRRSYRDFSSYDERKIRDRMEDLERFSTAQRKSQNDSQKLNRAEDIVKKATKRPADRSDYKIPPKVSKVEHQRLLKNVDVDEFLCVVHGQK